MLASCSHDPIGPLFVFKAGLYGLKDREGKVIVESRIAAIGNEPNWISTGNQYRSMYYYWNAHGILQWMNVGGTPIGSKATSTIYGGKWGLLRNLRSPRSGDTAFVESKYEAPAVFELIADPQFDWIGQFGNGLAAVLINGRWGFINENGELTIKAQFDDHGENPQSYRGWIRISDTARIGNRHAEELNQMLPWLYTFNKGRAWVCKAGKFGLIDTTGNFVLEPQIELIPKKYNANFEYRLFRQGDEDCAWFKQDNKFGLVDQEGQIAFPSVVDSVGFFKRFRNNFLWINYGKGYCLINSDGRVVIGPRFEDVITYGNYTLVGKPELFKGAVMGGRLGKVDSTGKIVIDPDTDSVKFVPVKFVGSGN